MLILTGMHWSHLSFVPTHQYCNSILQPSEFTKSRNREMNIIASHDTILNTVMQWLLQHRSDLEITEDTPYLALMGELWVVYCEYTKGLAQDYSNSSSLALELLQPCTKPSRYWTCYISTSLQIYHNFTVAGSAHSGGYKRPGWSEWRCWYLTQFGHPPSDGRRCGRGRRAQEYPQHTYVPARTTEHTYTQGQWLFRVKVMTIRKCKKDNTSAAEIYAFIVIDWYKNNYKLWSWLLTYHLHTPPFAHWIHMYSVIWTQHHPIILIYVYFSLKMHPFQFQPYLFSFIIY